MLTTVTLQDKLAAIMDVQNHTPNLVPSDAYAAVGQLEEVVTQLKLLLHSPEAQDPQVGGAFYNALRLTAASATGSLAAIHAGHFKLLP